MTDLLFQMASVMVAPTAIAPVAVTPAPVAAPSSAPSNDVDDIDDLIDAVAQEANDLAISSPPAPSMAPAPVAPPVAAPVSAPEPAHDAAQNSNSKLKALARHIYDLGSPDEEGCLTGMQLRPLMLMSKLPVHLLAGIWNAVDLKQIGKVCFKSLHFLYFENNAYLQIDQAQLVVLLGVLSQVQRDQAIDAAAINANSPVPYLEGLKPL